METDVEKIGKAVLDLSYQIHTRFGSGLLEKAYRVILAAELKSLGFEVEEEKVCGFTFNGRRYENMFRVDLLVNNLVVVELKSTMRMEKVYSKQCLTYLRLLDLHLGYVVNFGMTSLKDGIERIVNNLPEPPKNLTQSPRSPQSLDGVAGGLDGTSRDEGPAELRGLGELGVSQNGSSRGGVGAGCLVVGGESLTRSPQSPQSSVVNVFGGIQ